MSTIVTRPPLLEVIIDDLGTKPPLMALCAGYELGAWRSAALARHLIEAIPSFALTNEERETFTDSTGVEMMGRAVRSIYVTDKYSRRGEFGELLLHVILREVFGSIPAISKIAFKDAANDTVKGFDAVHIVEPTSGSLELWLGEVKFYQKLSQAIGDVVAELKAHVGHDYLRSEFIAIRGKLDPAWKHTPAVRELLDARTSLDTIFGVLTIPVLLTYESKAVADHVGRLAIAKPAELSGATQTYRSELEGEVRAGLASFTKHDIPAVRLRLILVPLHVKEALLSALDERLKAWQTATS